MYKEASLEVQEIDVDELSGAPVHLGPEALNDLISRLSIPPCPQVLLALLEEIRAEDMDFQRVVRLISGDVGLAAAMIRIANSPTFALSSKVQGVQQAVTVLGLKNVIQMVAGIELQRALASDLHMERYWERSGLHAVVCAALARHLKGIASEDAYTYGLFHDCGIPILAQYFSDYKRTLARANHLTRPMPELEYEIHGASHVLVGALLAEDWQLPDFIVRAIKGHHDPILLEDETELGSVRSLIAISMLADHLVARHLLVEDEAEWQACAPQVMECLGFDDEFLEEIVPEIDRQLQQVRADRGNR